MGKVLSSFTNGFPGAIARAIDDVAVPMANRSNTALAFGAPVALAADGRGVVPFDPASHTGADFVGIVVRNPVKTPDVYGENTASIPGGCLADILVRGHIIIRLEDTGALPGAQISVNSEGNFDTDTGSGSVVLPNVRVSSAPDSDSLCEVVLTFRNIL